MQTANVKTDFVPDVETQLQFEELYDKNQVMKRLKQEFDIPEIKMHLTKNNIPVDFGIALMSQMVLHKRATIKVLVGLLHRYFKDAANPFQECSYALVKAAEFNLVDYAAIGDTFILRPEVDVTQDVYDDLARYQYPLPMLIPPVEITKNNQSGYLRVQNSVILRDNHHEDDVCLDHLNRVNRTRYTINLDTALMIKNSWENLDKQKPGETLVEYRARIKAFHKYDTTSRDVIDHLVNMGNSFHLTHRYDKRGRTYCQGYHVTYQGNEWNKAVIEFANQEVCNKI